MDRGGFEGAGPAAAGARRGGHASAPELRRPCGGGDRWAAVVGGGVKPLDGARRLLMANLQRGGRNVRRALGLRLQRRRPDLHAARSGEAGAAGHTLTGGPEIDIGRSRVRYVVDRTIVEE